MLFKREKGIVGNGSHLFGNIIHGTHWQPEYGPAW